ncbi:MAG: response regulator [Bacteroidota bacterium]
MTSVRIFAVEDDLIHQENLRMTLDELGYELIGLESSAESALKRLPALKPDLFILDIQLSGKQDGIDLAHQINASWPSPIIYVTSFQDAQTYHRAQTTQPFAYLSKPLNPISLQSSIESALQHYAYQEETKPSVWGSDVFLHGSFFVKVGKKLIKFTSSEVRWIEVSGNRYCKVVSGDRQAHVRASLTEVQQKLAPDPFLRVHRSYLINPHFIEAIHEAEQWVSVDGQQIPIGKTYREDFFRSIRRL